MTTAIAAALIVPLAIPGYMLGSWRWLRRARGYYELAMILAAFFFGWYAILRLSGGSQALVPVAMLGLAVGFGVGRYTYWRGRRMTHEPNHTRAAGDPPPARE